MDKDNIIVKTKQYVQHTLSQDSTGHDWWHVYRVWKTARYLAAREQADSFIIELSALLHDIADWKFHHGNDRLGAIKAREWLISLGMNIEDIEPICNIIDNLSFKGAWDTTKMTTLEGQIVQDADRLDALGAVGIARTFAYGGAKGRPLHDPSIVPIEHHSFEAYKTHQGTTFNHFTEKLLRLKNLMNTPTAQHIAQERHDYMEQFMMRFLHEWDAIPE